MWSLKKRGTGDRGRGTATSARRAFWLLLIACCSVFVAGCRQDMQDQPKYEVYEASKFFKNGLSSRPIIEGTVPRGYLRADAQLYTGKMNRSQASAADGAAQQTTPSAVGANAQQQQSASGQNQAAQNAGNANTVNARVSASSSSSAQTDVDTFPFPVTAEVLNRGQERYQIFCAVCHGATGNGDGMIVRRGFKRPPPYNTDALRQAPVGHFYDVITNGWGAMPNYAAQVPVQDRWAIVAYIRALQLNQGDATTTTTTETTPNANASVGQQPVPPSKQRQANASGGNR